MTLDGWDEWCKPETRLAFRCFQCGRSFRAVVSEPDLSDYIFNERDGTFSQDNVLCPQCESAPPAGEKEEGA